MTWTAMSGMIAGQTTTVAVSSAATLPTTNWVAVNWQVMLSHTGYVNGLHAVGAASLNPGTTTNVETWWLTPVDLNSNGIADAWETLYFGAGANVDPTADADGDGLNNHAEYLAGTNPKDAQSALKFSQAAAVAANVTLHWPVAEGRVYEVLGTSLTGLALPTPSWQLLDGPWTSDVGVTEMNWSAPAAAVGTGQVYRIELLPP